MNLVTEPDRYPIPQIHTFTDKLFGSTNCSTLDLSSAYHQIPVNEEGKNKTSIITSFGLFLFNFMPFGLKNLSSTFQRFMNEVMFDLPFIFCYIDNILIFSKSENEHLQHVKTVFERLRNYGVTINPDKCHFNKPSVKFLGHMVNSLGISTLPDKVEAINNFPRSTSQRSLRRFVGLVNFL